MNWYVVDIKLISHLVHMKKISSRIAIIFYILLPLFFCTNLKAYELDLVEPFLTPGNIQWQDGAPPAEIRQKGIFKKWWREVGCSSMKSLRWSNVSILTEGNKEMIVQNTCGGTGGLATLVLFKKNNQWAVLIDIFGGFVFQNVPSPNHKLVLHVRMGAERERSVLEYKNGRYKQIAFLEFQEHRDTNRYRVGNQYLESWEYFWYLNRGN